MTAMACVTETFSLVDLADSLVLELQIFPKNEKIVWVQVCTQLKDALDEFQHETLSEVAPLSVSPIGWDVLK